MSYIQFVGTASLQVPEDFDLDSTLADLSRKCVAEDNFIAVNYGEEDGVLDLDFESYVRFSDGEILIEIDTEESNGDSEVWDWLIDQFVDFMISPVIEVKSACIDSRSGVDVDVYFYTKNRECIYTAELIRNHLNSVTA
jgi:hypothetical protein